MSDEEDTIRNKRNPYDHPYKYGRQLINRALATWKKDKPRCVICGEYGETTREHAPPQTIYSEVPEDFITVPACDKCQSSEDEGFRDFLAFSCARRPTQSSKQLLQEVSDRFSFNTQRRAYLDLINDKSKVKEVVEYDNVTKKEESKVAVKWPRELHDPIVLKIAHACNWLFNEGDLLCDEKGQLVIVPNYDPTTVSGNNITGNSHPSINVGNSQFIVTLIMGFRDPPFDTTFSMGFHFHSDNDIQKGYSVMVFFMFDKYRQIGHKQSEIFESILAKAPSESIYDLAIPVYKHYPY